MSGETIESVDQLRRYCAQAIYDSGGMTQNPDGTQVNNASAVLSVQAGAMFMDGHRMTAEQKVREIEEKITLSKSEFNNVLKVLREARMAVTSEVNAVAKAFDTLSAKKKEADEMVVALMKLKDLLSDPVLKGVLK